jgi:hypothetical protein
MSIEPTEADIGRRVVYRPIHLDVPEEGEITSLSTIPHTVFVRFRGPGGELTPTQSLEWVSP